MNKQGRHGIILEYGIPRKVEKKLNRKLSCENSKPNATGNNVTGWKYDMHRWLLKVDKTF